METILSNQPTNIKNLFHGFVDLFLGRLKSRG